MNKANTYSSLLVVGNIDLWLGADNELPDLEGTIFCVFSDLTTEFLNRHLPDVILTPLVTSQFDVLELAIKLDQLDFEGRVRAICAPLPNPELILSEIRFECPALDFDLIVVQPNQILRSV